MSYYLKVKHEEEIVYNSNTNNTNTITIKM